MPASDITLTAKADPLKYTISYEMNHGINSGNAVTEYTYGDTVALPDASSWILPLYSIVTYMAALKTVDFIVDGFDHAKCAMIITTKADEICDALSLEFESGLTKINAVGGYSGIERTVIYFVVNRFQITKMREIISEIDPSAFIALHDITDVFSENQ